MTRRPAKLELRDLRKSYEGLPVLASVSLTVGEGEFVSMLGPSGAGKSTIFRILTGAAAADSGEVCLDGAPLPQSGGRFAFMPQRDALLPWRRVLANATLGLEIQGVPRAEAERRVLPLMAQFGLAGFERHYPAQLSGGMRQRAALLRTVVQDRDVLLLDEPFGALDALTRTGMQAWLEEMWRRNRWTALLVTHDVREAVFLSDRIYVLSPRPARVVREIEVPIRRPRTIADLTSPVAARIESELLEALLGSGFPGDSRQSAVPPLTQRIGRCTEAIRQ